MTTVNEVNMAKWIVALRSGKYKQGKGGLRGAQDSYCCLGVACDISELGRWNDVGYYITLRDSRSTCLPDSVADWFGTAPNPVLTDSGACVCYNDHVGWNFGQIAIALESRYLPGKKAEEILAGAA